MEDPNEQACREFFAKVGIHVQNMEKAMADFAEAAGRAGMSIREFLTVAEAAFKEEFSRVVESERQVEQRPFELKVGPYDAVHRLGLSRKERRKYAVKPKRRAFRI